MEKLPRNCRFLFLVVIERVLTFDKYSPMFLRVSMLGVVLPHLPGEIFRAILSQL